MMPIVNKKERIPDEVFMKAMSLYDNGKTIPEILALFPEHKDELIRTFEVVKVLKAEKENIYPSKESLVKIISAKDTSEGVTDPGSDRYLFRGSFEKGRASSFQFFNLQLPNLFNMNPKIYAGVAVLLLVLGLGLIYRQSQRGGDSVASDLEKQLSRDEESFDKDVADLENMNNDTSLDNLDGDLADISGEGESSGGVQLASIENMDTDFEADMNNFTKELNELDSMNSDTSLDSLDSGLSTISQ